MTKEMLNGMSKKDVMAKAKELGISRYRNSKLLTKDEIIDAICEYEKESVQEAMAYVEAPENEKIVEQVEQKVDDGLTDEQRKERHNKYVEDVKVGTLVAFKTAPNKAKSAMVVKRSTKNRKLKVQTKYGKEFIISFDDVIWVHTNKRWPRGVYNMLKGKVDKDEGSDKVD